MRSPCSNKKTCFAAFAMAPEPVAWQPIYLSSFIIIISLIFLYYNDVIQIIRGCKLFLHFAKGLTSNTTVLKQLLHGLPSYLLGINHEYGFGSSSTAQQIAMKNIENLYNKTIIVTGGNSGIGYSLCLAFCAVSHHQSEALDSDKYGNPCSIIMGSRNADKSQLAIKQILSKYPQASIRFIPLDLSSFKSISSFVDSLKNDKNVQILINNAGIGMIEKGRSFEFDKNLNDRFEAAFTVNYLGPFMLTQLIYERYMRDNEKVCRVINTSSIGHAIASSYSEDELVEINKIAKYHLNCAYDHVFAYAVSKLLNILHASMMAQEYAQNGVLINSCNPGTSLDTGITANYFSSPYLMKIVNDVVGCSTKILISQMDAPQGVELIRSQFNKKN